MVIIVISLLLGAISGCKSEFQPGTYTDDMGREVTIDSVPQRIVSHVPSITEMLFALNLADSIVGVSDYCNYPEEAKQKPSVGNYFDPSIESIVALEPDLVLTDGHSDGIQQLDGLGINYLVIDPKDIDGIFHGIELLGKAIGIEDRAEDLIDDMSAEIARTTALVQGAPILTVFYIIDASDPNNPWTAGPGSFIDSLITMAGGENVAGDALSAWTQFSIEVLVAADPDIIMVDCSHGTAVITPAELREHPIWREMTAVKEGRIYLVDGDLVNRSGPRIVDGLEEIARAIHPELFD
jgi:iron complex transport system substrate-binding protein